MVRSNPWGDGPRPKQDIEDWGEDPTPEMIAEITSSWTAEAKAAAQKRIDAFGNVERTIYFCSRGRNCGGKAHDGVPYEHARPDQWPPAMAKAWMVWALMGGRGSGKTRTGAEFTRRMTDKAPRLALIGVTSTDIRDTMIEGVSGLIKVYENYGEKILYEPSKRRITFPNGARAGLFSAEEPDRLRGPQHHFGWLDEPAHMDLITEVWDNFLFGLRLGNDPRCIVTTTPTPTPWVKELITEDDTILARVSTYANEANLAPSFLKKMKKKYEGTRQGRQELHGEVLMDVEGALWNDDLIVRHFVEFGVLDRIIVAIDPAGTANRKSDETGIIVVGKMGDDYYVLDDFSGKYSPNEWATKALDAYDLYQADAIVAEKNYGGDMVSTTIESNAKDRKGLKPRIIVATAMRNKQLRAEPVVALYEQRHVYHSPPRGREDTLAKLETEMTSWVPGKGDSPNRVDALVWAVTELDGDDGIARFASPRKTDPSPTGNVAPLTAAAATQLILPSRFNRAAPNPTRRNRFVA